MPSGVELRTKATQLIPDDEAYQFALASLSRFGVEAGQLKRFVDDLTRHPEKSIDAFLEKHQKEKTTMLIGKAVTAALMAEAIAGAEDPLVDKDWLLHIVQRMLDNASTWESFVENNAQVRFITFNFDTFIEDRLARLFHDSFPSQYDGTAAKVCPVTHVYVVRIIRTKRPFS